MYVYFNNNPLNRVTGDCVPRAISKLLNQSWDKTYTDLCLVGIAMGLMPSNNEVHIRYLAQHGYKIHSISDNCPDCITVKQFSELYPNGKYILAMGDHIVCLIQGNYFDVFDSGNEIISYYFSK